MDDKLTLENGQVVKAVFLGLDTEGDGQYGKWYKYSLKVDGKELVFFANEKNKSTFDGLNMNDEFSFGKVKKESSKGIYHKIERVGDVSGNNNTLTTEDIKSSSNTNGSTRSFSTREASIVSGVAVKVAGWSLSPTTFSEAELYKRSKIVLSVLNKLETDLLHKNVEELFGAVDAE